MGKKGVAYQSREYNGTIMNGGHTMEKGWWSLTITGDFELNDDDLRHIANLVKQGFTSGEIIHDDEEIKEDIQ